MRWGSPKNRGELVGRVEPGQGAAKAGIQQGDVIVKVNNREVTPDETLSYIVAQLPIGSRVPIELFRAGKRMTVTATLAERPTDEQLATIVGDSNGGLAPEDQQTAGNAAREALGLAVQGLTPEISRSLNLPVGTRGVVVGAVDPSSDAAGKGIQRGDVVTSVNQQPILPAADLTAAVNSARAAGRGSVLALIQRGNNTARYIPLKLKAK